MDYATMQRAIEATAGFRGTTLKPLSGVIGDLVALRAGAYAAYRYGLGRFGQDLPDNFAEVVAAAAQFADPLVDAGAADRTWDPTTRRWLGRPPA